MRHCRYISAIIAVVMAGSFWGTSASGEPGASAPQAAAATTSQMRQRLLFWLNAYHRRPTREQLDQIGDATAVGAMLREIGANAQARPSLRLRALDALGLYSDAATVAFLRRLIDPPDGAEAQPARVAGLLRQHAISSYARAERAAAVDLLAGFVDDDDLQIRLAAVSAIGRFGGQVGQRRLRRLRARVDDAVVLEQMKKFIAASSK